MVSLWYPAVPSDGPRRADGRASALAGRRADRPAPDRHGRPPAPMSWPSSGSTCAAYHRHCWTSRHLTTPRSRSAPRSRLMPGLRGSRTAVWHILEHREMKRLARDRAGARTGQRPQQDLPAGTDLLPQIKHIVVLMMENHSYDNYLGMLQNRGEGFPLDSGGKPDLSNIA